jgi:hypothetical protein
MKYRPNINISDQAKSRLVKVGGILLALFLADKAIASAAKDSADAQLDKDPAAGQARALDAALNPGFKNWIKNGGGADTNAVWDIAPQITDLDKVRDYYKAQTKTRDLNDDLETVLGPDGYQKFLAFATKGKTGNTKYATTLKPIPAKQWVITKLEANIRKTPKVESKWLPGNNIVKLVKPGMAVGATTGKFVYDAKDDVTFIEFYTFGTKQAGKQYFYVAKSQVELISDEEKKKRDKVSKIPLELLAGLTGVAEDQQKQVVTKRAAMLYDEQMQPLMIVPKNIILGYPVMTMDTGKKKLMKVQTVQGNFRWVELSEITIQDRT